MQVHRVAAPARDGTAIPITVIHRAGLPRDGTNPTLLMGYGSYGMSATPRFDAGMLAWLECGGIYAVAHIRGGGEYGRDWHEAGRLLTKENTISDFIDCAEQLVALGYTQPGRLAGKGVSAGGIPSGGALTRRPDLWAAMVLGVPLVNALRAEFGENGPVNVPEFGSVSTEEGLRSLTIADAYQRVRNGTQYPAVLLTTGRNDPRVPTWQPGKMAARLQAATGSDRPVLLRVEDQGGHGRGSTAAQREAQLADELAFLMYFLGHPSA
jgi:prolyl oligopeptidase